MDVHASHPWLGVTAGLTAGLMLVLILAGGFVTSTATGDTIPTWPYSWGSYEGGAWVEWAHRAVAGLVLLASAALAIGVQRSSAPDAARRLAWLAFAAVVIQALIGGLRIHMPKATVAIVHAVFAQIVFCSMAAIVLMVSRAWRETDADPEAAAARKLAVVTTAFAFLQLVAGAVTRHTGAGLEVHLAGAVLVLVHVTLLGSRLMNSRLRKGGLALLTLMAVQVVLGLASWAITRAPSFVRSVEAPKAQLVVVTLHVAVGASVLAACWLLVLRCFRASRAVPQPAPVLEPNRA
ncbi:MAG: COX15/CtaA family protein [Planctomycetes bacterium]|nr:COX15/CtaA family protein [Planctomycetota bacterium]